MSMNHPTSARNVRFYMLTVSVADMLIFTGGQRGTSAFWRWEGACGPGWDAGHAQLIHDAVCPSTRGHGATTGVE